MFDHGPVQTPMQRARGRGAVGFAVSNGRTRLTDLHQSGCAKVMLPKVPGEPEAVFLNTAGGLTGGDRLEYELTLGAGARATATTQTAERAYASSGGAAEVRCHMAVGEGASLDWLPQETILFDRSALNRTTRLDLAADAKVLFCETLVLGRAAMGETVEDLWLSDRREVRRCGRPVLIDPVRMDTSCLAGRDNPALLGGARAVALLALLAQGAEDALSPVRAVLPDCGGVTAAASAWDGRCLVRLMAGDAWPLRKALVKLVTHFRGTVPPRVWQN
ncbi:urease accessory protein [Aliiruegeria haliotis]|uniref:Urease accessory protein UreD n=1 Tax=Aliiruegeria haliotis TaxID=1280846 RepID=A0A2T0RVP4_9RHOB|nr:urease accessory protein UreD [Aliiruegeria haliotis]PRY25218.1 urease accessory protein [Aliiruegeria haliotis]